MLIFVKTKKIFIFLNLHNLFFFIRVYIKKNPYLCTVNEKSKTGEKYSMKSRLSKDNTKKLFIYSR